MWEIVFNLGASAAATEFFEWFPIRSDSSNLIHLHGFHLLVLQPLLVAIFSFVCISRICLFGNPYKIVLKLARFTYENKIMSFSSPTSLG